MDVSDIFYLFFLFWGGGKGSACAPLCCKNMAVRPVFARVVGELWVADPSSVQGRVKQNASAGEQSEAPGPRWKPGQEQNPGPENQASQYMLEQPRGYFPELRGRRPRRRPGGPV